MPSIECFVRGYFEGTYFQTKVSGTRKAKLLESFMPPGLKLYRGIIHEPVSISNHDFISSTATLSFQRVNNIQINTNPNKWPFDGPRIYSLAEVKFISVRGLNLHQLNEQGYFDIQGELVASVAAERYPDESIGHKKGHILNSDKPKDLFINITGNLKEIFRLKRNANI